VNVAFVLATAAKDLRRRARDPIALVLWIGIPLVIMSLILLAFGGSDTVPTARLLILDHDKTFVSGLLENALQKSPVIETEQVESTDARRLIEDGKATALLTVPAGFGTAVMTGDSVALSLVTNPAQRILPGIVEENVSMLVDATFYLQELFGDELAAFASGPTAGFGFDQGTLDATTSSVNARIQRIGPYLAPPVITLETEREVRDTGESLGLGALFFPGILFMSLLFMGTGLASDVWLESELGTIRRAKTTPQRMTDFLAGKTLAGTALIAGVCLVALLIGAWAFGVRPAVIPLALLWAAFSGTVFLILLTLIQLYASSARTAGTLTTMIIFPLMMVGGSFFPFEGMPPFLANIGKWTPNGWALTQLKSILWGGIEPAALGLAIAVLVTVGIVGFALGARRLSHGFVTG